MQFTRFFMLQAALAAAQLPASGDDDTSSRGTGNALAGRAEGEPAVTTPSSLRTHHSSLHTISKTDPTATVYQRTAVGTAMSNTSSPPDPEADLPVGSTGVGDEGFEGGSPQFLESNQPVPGLAPVQRETAPAEVLVQSPEQAASPPMETTGVFTSVSPSSTIATTTDVVSNIPTFYENFAPIPVEDPALTPTVIPSSAEATKAAILAFAESSSQVSDIQSLSTSTSDPNPSSTSTSPSDTAVTETAIPASSITFSSVITSSTDSARGFVVLATDSSSSSSSFSSASSSLPSSLTTPSPTPSSSLSSTTSTTTTTTDQPAMASNADIDASLQEKTASYPPSSNEYLSSQAKVAIILVSVFGVLAVMTVIGYVLWHVRMRDARLERQNRAALARRIQGGGGGKEGNGAQGHKRNLSVEEKMKQALEREHDVPLGVGKIQAEEHGNPTDGRAVNLFSTISTISESSEESEDSQGSGSQRSYGNNGRLAVVAAPMVPEDSDMATSMANRNEASDGYGLGRSDSQDSKESYYSEGGQDGFGRSETLDAQRRRYVHERSESLRSQWSNIEDYYRIERLETEAQGGAETLESEETFGRTESNASTSSGRSGRTIGKAL
ncbi:hypothetical protein NEUTE1DRAFT_120806 [Neurospora tetrasperma FGSC 2508]|uniref:Mid2 domain-containing protein n=1 Tax=Neurospora tetrasperma (strain FGSC 2508 / ATCC MYA-4615 / P0657) TaxID=510951 RepID=F8MI33_NEUT8|nr:uncharacterized protein NEUTE1DRAFT_120806 [Neurospora tetrasperma FGSC 2508]EGO58889.1 hypothetical protein NEUTE1DRAFT_120806 [Neurospora tetrasperma FGSC 2508]EGZ72990.1 hypothetical protein NEUTE2DRAFT_156554 [Neurospora tetrasperma FGSC 2509]